MGCIYVAINRINGKSYVGKSQCKTKTKRMNGHHKNAFILEYRSKFYSALRKYGRESFEW